MKHYATRREQLQDSERLRAAGWNIDLDGLWRKPGLYDGTDPVSFDAAVAQMESVRPAT